MCRCIGTRMSACTAASDDGRPCGAGGQYRAVGRSGVSRFNPIQLNPICGARSNSSAADVVTAVIHSNETVPGERGNFHAGHSYSLYTRTASGARPHRTSGDNVSQDHSPRASPVCRPQSCLSQLTATAEPLPCRPCSLLSCETVPPHSERNIIMQPLL